MTDNLFHLTSGGIVVLDLVAALFFFKFWRTGRDSLFLFFSAALVILGAERLFLALASESRDGQTHLYLLRLLGYLLLVAGIAMKNLPGRDSERPRDPKESA